ncbi:precorrin-6y C5,15-methyltransferase (decarboxylating) subunit CbiE [Actinokineospora sp. 24-640]
MAVIGVGVGGLPPGAGEVVAKADVVVGVRAVVQEHAPGAASVVEVGPCGIDESVVDKIGAAVRTGEAVVVLAAGDPGYFGVLRELRQAGLPVTVVPGVSDVARLAAMVKRPWDDITVVSGHGRDFRQAVNVCRARPAVAVLTAPRAGPAELARELDGWHRYLAVLEDVGGNEKLSIVDASEASRKAWRTPNLLLCLGSLDAQGERRWIAGGEPTPAKAGWAPSAAAFATREGVGIPEDVRAVVLARLAPRPGLLVWDVRAQEGAVGIGAALLGAAVIAVEGDAALCVRIVANAGAHGVEVRLEDEERHLGRLPRPDAVFLRHARPELVRACAGVGAARVVVLVSELDTLKAVWSTLSDAGYHVHGSQFTAAPLCESRVLPGESSFLLWGIRD